MIDTMTALTSALQRTVDALDEFRTKTSKNYNPSDIDEICDAGHDLIEKVEQEFSEGFLTTEISWQDVHRAFPALTKEDCIEFMIINRSDIIARMKDAALKAILERGTTA